MRQGQTGRPHSPPAATERSPAGGYVLSLLARPLMPQVLRALEERPLRLGELRKRLGWSAQTTLRTRLTTLGELEAIAKRPCGAMPYAVENELTAFGREMLAIADALEAWLARSPQGRLELGSEPGKAAVKALAGGWDSAIIRALATGPLTLSQIDERIPGVRYPTLERRLASMRAMDLVEPSPGAERGTPYALTDWMRRGMAPLALAARCERRHMEARPAPATSVDTEIAFLLVLPLLELPSSASGTCQLAVHFGANGRPPAGVHVGVKQGRVVSSVAGLVARPDTWAIGSIPGWLEAVVEGHGDGLRIGGRDPAFARQIVEGLHAALFES